MSELEIGTTAPPTIQTVAATPPSIQVLTPTPPGIEVFHMPTALVEVGVSGSLGEGILQAYEEAEADSTIEPGQPLYLKPNGHVGLASAAAIGTSRVCGLALAAAAVATSVPYSPDGSLVVLDWTAVTGTATLTPGATYFLSPVPGKLTTAAPTQSGQVVLAVGNALSTTRLAIEIQTPFLL